MLTAVIIAVAIYAVRLMAYGTQITPDGQYYLAMRAGIVPRPYCLRPLPRVMGSIMAWRILHAVSYVIVAVCGSIVAEQAGVSAPLVVGLMLALPWLRTAVSWPVLLDVPMLAVACLAAAVAPSAGVWIGVLILASAVVHERAPLWSALYAAPYVDQWWHVAAPVVVAGLLYVIMHRRTPKHPDETRIEWLAHPIKAAWLKHRATLHDARVWILPLGGSAIGVLSGDTWLWVIIALAYGGCMAAQDRARIYGMAALPLCLAAVDVAGAYAVLLPIVTWFINTKEV